MDFKSLLLVLSISSLLISSNAARPSFHVRSRQFPPTSAPSFRARALKFPPTSAPEPETTSSSSSLNDTEVDAFWSSSSSLNDTEWEEEDAYYAKKYVTADVVNPTLCASNHFLCIHNISEFLKKEPITGLKIEVGGILRRAKKINKIITMSLKDPSTDKKALGALQICKRKYGAMVRTCKGVIEMIEQKNVVDAYPKFNFVTSYKTSCDDAFTKSPGVKMPFKQEDALTIYQYAGKTLTLMNAVINHVRV